MRVYDRGVLAIMVFALLGSVPMAMADQGTVEKRFAPAGRVRMDLSAGAYTVRAGRDDRIYVQWETRAGEGNQAKVDIQVNGTSATIRTDGPRNNFRVTIELPARSDLNVDLVAGDLRIDAITGNKDISSWAGNIIIDVGRAEDYRQVDASVKAGDISAAPFNERKGGLFRSFSWKGPGQYTLKVNLTAGNLALR